MHKITKGSQIRYLLTLLLLLFSLSSWSSLGNEDIITITSTKNDSSCPGGNDGSISVTPTGGLGPYTFSWTGPVAMTETGVFTSNLSNLQAGTFSVSITDNSTPPSIETFSFTVSDLDTEVPSIVDPGAIVTSASVVLADFGLTNPATNDNCSVLPIIHDGTVTYNLGENLINWVVADASGNINTLIQSVTVSDDIAPIITCPSPSNPYNTDAGSCFAALTFEATATDNSGSVSISYNIGGNSISFPHNFPIGSTVVRAIAEDGNGQTDECSFTVVVEDNEKPVISASADISENTDNGQCEAAISITPATATDNCSVGSPSGSRDDGLALSDPYPLGKTTITWTVTDANGNVADSVDQEVEISDNEKPVISASADISENTDNGQCEAAISITPATATDNCSVGSPSGSRDDGLALSDPYPLGKTTITWTVTDANGNVADSVDQEVEISDNEKPVISASADISENTDNGQCEAAISITPATATDNCSVGSPSGSRDDGLALSDPYPLGTTTITWTVTDDNGNIADSVDQEVEITDNEKPVITASADISENTDNGQCEATISITPATATDNCSVGSPSGSRDDGLALSDPYPLGTTTITWTVTDANGNLADSVDQEVEISDNEKPVISASADISENTDNGQCEAAISITPATATDNCSVGSPSGSRDDGLALSDPYPLGTTTITWTVTDANGNVADSVDQDVEITDNEKPVITASADISENTDNGQCEATISITPATATDNCSVGSPSGSRDDGLALSDPYPLGTTTITWTVTDDNGNVADSVNQEVEITDNEAPVPPTIDDIFRGCEYTVEAPIAADNCNGNITGTTIDPVTYNTDGTYTITWEFEDAAGNTSTATQEITIDLLEQSVSIESVDCNGASTGAATATATGGTAPYTYTWDSLGNGASKNGLSSGTYFVTVTDGNGCQVRNEVLISEPDGLAISGTITQETSCYEAADGAITAGTVTGGTPPYEYSLDNSNFQTSTTFNNLSAGDYTIFIKDANDCAIQDNITVNEPDVLNADLSKTNVLCNGGASGTISLSDLEGGSGTYEFSIDNTNWQTETTFSGLTAGDYPIYIRDASATSCIILLNNSYSITEPTVLVATATSTPTTTFGSSTGSAMVNPSGGTSGYTYEWRATGDTEVITTTRTANNLSAGEYEVTVTDANDCQVVVSSIIVRDAITGEVESATLCEGENVQDGQVRTAFFRLADFTALGGYGNYEYIWDFGSGIPSETGPGQHAVKYNTSGNKTITVTITDRDDQGNIFQTITLTQQQYVGLCHEPCGQAQNAQFDVDAIYIGYLNGDSMEENSADLCDETIDKYLFLPVSKSVNMYNPYTEITFKTTNAATDQFDNQFDDAGTGKCKDEDEIDEIPASENQGKINKVGDWIRLTVAPIEYQCGDALEIEGFYITYTNNSKMDCYSNNNGFCYSINEPVTVPTPVYVEATPTDLFCKGEATGFITARGSGGFAPYSYNITSANDAYFSNNTFNNLSAGNYTVYIQDSRGNRNSTSVTISEPDTAISVSTAKTDPECFGDFGTATATATGGTPFSGDTYEYLWNDSEEQTTATATNLVAGSYTVTVTDANGCQDIKSVTIIEPEELTTSDAGPNQQLNCGIYDTKLQANTPSSGIGTWSIDTANSSTGGTILDSTDANSGFSAPAGTYTLEWTIANPDGGCASIDTVIITVDGECSMLDFDGVDDHVYFDNNYNFTTGSFTFEVWVKPEAVSGTQTIFSKRDKSNLSSGGYDLIINGGSPTFRWKGKTATTNKKITTARWHHLAVIFQSNTARLYVDGIEVGTATAVNPANTSSPFILGAMYDSSTPLTAKNYYSGWMEELRIWNTALSPDQLRFMMNQRVESNDGITKGDVLPFNVPNDLLWSNLAGYYRLQIEDITGGITPDISSTKVDGILRNITTNQYTSAPLPYVSEDNGNWRERGTWDTNIGNTNENWWSVPNDKGINDQQINWNIVKTRHDINSGQQDITLLGLISEANKLEMEGDVNTETGQGLTISKYLELDGVIDLNGNSQLIQTEGSILATSSSGYIDIDQQGTANSFNYNYWSSPVSITGSANNSGFTIGGVLMDGNDPDNPKTINFNGQYHWADGSYTGNKRISTYWLYNFGDPEDNFNGDADDYLSWSQFDESELLPPGIGYTMKGTTGYVPISTRQNYTFRGKPNNGDIEVQVAVDQNLLTGNPYPSAIDALQFINENLSDFNGALYFWDHFGKEDSHYLEEYVGGYAVYNLSGGISSASSIDSRINDNDESSQKDPPGQFIPVGQAFFINTLGVNNPLTITYKNKYRAFVLESDKDSNGNDLSQFHSQEKENPKENQHKASLDERHKIRLKFESPKGYHRQILVTADENTTSGFDLGYDAPLIENNVEDMYWMVDSTEFVIQAVPDFALERILPLGIKIAETGEFTIKIDETENIKSGFEIYLRDKTIDEYYKISEQDFTTTIEETGFFNDRFELVFRSQEENSEEDTSDTEGGNEEQDKETPAEAEKPDLNPEDAFLGLQYYKNTDEIALSNPDLLNITQVEIYSISGQKIMSFDDIPTERYVQLRIRQQLSSAVYVVKLYSGKKVYSKKVIISK